MLIVGVPFINGLNKTRGCEKAPELFMKLIKNMICIDGIDNTNIAVSIQKIYKTALKVLKENFNRKILFLGGDHSISYPLVKAFNKVYTNSTLIVLDAHADCMKPMKEPTNEEWLRAVIENSSYSFDTFDRIVLAGLRKIEPEEKRFLNKDTNITIIGPKKIAHYFRKLLQAEKSQKEKSNIYLSIDVDVFDKKYAPGVAYPEPNGINFYEFLRLLMAVKDNLKVVDLVEINPTKDINEKTLKLGLKIIKAINKNNC